ncbi:MAG: (d)CMP kinase [Erysipelothrix sp.]|nr:(d)CMP kinase [Erysipelothrix sp.]
MFNVAIDGPSAAGKSTISKIIANKYNLVKLDTGAMYRIVALLVSRNNLDVNSEEAVLSVFDNMDLEVMANGDMILNGALIRDEIRNDEISMLASTASKHELVRARLVKLQQDIAKAGGYLLEGRDIGTVVLKDAEVKIYLEADSEVRAQRRYDEYIANNLDVAFADIKQDIEKRDYQDKNREHSPLRQADDAVLIDVSHLSIDEVVDAISAVIDSKVVV